MSKKLEQWMKMTNAEKSRYNGYTGFEKGETWQNTSLFKLTKTQKRKKNRL